MLRPGTTCLLALALAGCADDPASLCEATLDWGRGGEHMLPGTDCAECHRAGGSAPDAVYPVAGTVFADPDCPIPVAGAVVRVLAGNGVTTTMMSNGSGNFFTDDAALVPPFTVAVEVDGVVATMRYPIDNGSCGRCHAPGSALGLVWVSP